MKTIEERLIEACEFHYEISLLTQHTINSLFYLVFPSRDGDIPTQNKIANLMYENFGKSDTGLYPACEFYSAFRKNECLVNYAYQLIARNDKEDLHIRQKINRLTIEYYRKI